MASVPTTVWASERRWVQKMRTPWTLQERNEERWGRVADL